MRPSTCFSPALSRLPTFGRATVAFLVLAIAGFAPIAQANTPNGELRLITHSSFSLPQPLLAQFEKQAGVKLVVVKAGDAGEMLNKLILTKANPIADVVYGIDNTLAAKALAAGVLQSDSAAAAPASANADPLALPTPLMAVDYGYVALNYDKAAIVKKAMALPTSLDDLALPAYQNTLAMPNPATSSTGYAFLLATIAAMGEEKAFAWWAKMRSNGIKVTKGWSEAYNTEFSRNGGARPFVVSYASSPAAEVFYSKEKIDVSPTANLFLPGSVFKQVEAIAPIRGGSNPEATTAFIAFMRSPAVQQALQTSMWMYPVASTATREPVLLRHAQEPTAFETLPLALIAEKGPGWVSRWTQVVLK